MYSKSRSQLAPKDAWPARHVLREAKGACARATYNVNVSPGIILEKVSRNGRSRELVDSDKF